MKDLPKNKNKKRLNRKCRVDDRKKMVPKKFDELVAPISVPETRIDFVKQQWNHAVSWAQDGFGWKWL